MESPSHYDFFLQVLQANKVHCMGIYLKVLQHLNLLNKKRC